jgi:hypothetical protein
LVVICFEYFDCCIRYVLCILCIVCVQMCTVLLQLGVNPIAVKYTYSISWISPKTRVIKPSWISWPWKMRLKRCSETLTNYLLCQCSSQEEWSSLSLSTYIYIYVCVCMYVCISFLRNFSDGRKESFGLTKIMQKKYGFKQQIFRVETK